MGRCVYIVRIDRVPSDQRKDVSASGYIKVPGTAKIRKMHTALNANATMNLSPYPFTETRINSSTYIHAFARI